MNAVEVFHYNAMPVRTLTGEDSPWFVAADVCSVLGLGNPTQTVSYLDDDERDLALITDEGGTERTVNIVSEPGLYSLILRSRKPQAKAFKRWITHEVLPALRQHGRYEVAQLDELEVARRYVLALEAKRTAEAKVAELAPKAEAHDAFESADGTYSFEQVAKMLHTETGLGRNNLIKRLRAVAVLTDKNLPYQRYAHHFHVVASSFEHTDGRREMSYTTRVRATGVDFIRRKLGAAQGVLVPVP